MGWLWLVGSIKLYVSFAKEAYKRDDILQKRPMIFICRDVLVRTEVRSAEREGSFAYMCLHVVATTWHHLQNDAHILQNDAGCTNVDWGWELRHDVVSFAEVSSFAEIY